MIEYDRGAARSFVCSNPAVAICPRCHFCNTSIDLRRASLSAVDLSFVPTAPLNPWFGLSCRLMYRPNVHPSVDSRQDAYASTWDQQPTYNMNRPPVADSGPASYDSFAPQDGYVPSNVPSCVSSHLFIAYHCSRPARQVVTSDRMTPLLVNPPTHQPANLLNRRYRPLRA